MVQNLNTPALQKSWVLDAQWTDCPPEVEQVVKDLWSVYELGNDHYMLRRDIRALQETQDQQFEVEKWVEVEGEFGWHKRPLDLQPLITYLRDKGIGEDESVIIHWWW